jgi:hypothetical protein
MKEIQEQITAVCGLDCAGCPLRKASLGDVEAAQSLVGWWKGEGWLKEGEGAAEILARGPLCLGCRGDRSAHWSPDCWILKCCVDEKGLASCHECDVFPCQRLTERAKESAGYAQALDRLQSMQAVLGCNQY